jgi:hypothetical protein
MYCRTGISTSTFNKNFKSIHCFVFLNLVSPFYFHENGKKIPSVEVSSNNGCIEMGSDADAEMTNSKRNIQDRVQLSSSKLGVPCSGMGSAKFV